jgi:hypothetical protein
MIMKKVITLFVLFFSVTLINAQSNLILKKYSGDFKDDNGISGTANYSYYEKDYNYIKEGPFVFTYLRN